MKALSIKQPWAWMIADGKKTIETRTWATKYRGEILIVASKGKMLRTMAESFETEFPGKAPAIKYGMAIAIAKLVDCRPMTAADEIAACCPIYDKAYSWVLENIRKIKPFPQKGQLQIYEVEMPVDFDYEVLERFAILTENNPDMNPVHAKNKAKKEIRERSAISN